jgi:hypothetical protein
LVAFDPTPKAKKINPTPRTQLTTATAFRIAARPLITGSLLIGIDLRVTLIWTVSKQVLYPGAGVLEKLRGGA